MLKNIYDKTLKLPFLWFSKAKANVSSIVDFFLLIFKYIKFFNNFFKLFNFKFKNAIF